MKKISVMIVDDEKLVLEDLKTLVDWEALGFEIVATAFNGRQALEKYKKYRPQVVFTDVKMPFMDGLELIRKLRELDKDSSIFLLTAYEDFTYARTAIKYGVKDYVIKSTLDENTFAELLSGLRESIGKQSELRDILTEQKILEYMEGPEGEEALGPLYRKEYAYLLVEQDRPLAFADDTLPDELVCKKKAMAAAISRVSLPECETAVVSHMPKQRVLAVLDVQEVSQQKITKTVHAYACQISQILQDTFDFSFTIYAVDHKMTLSKLKTLYSQNSEALERKYILGSGRIIRLSELKWEKSRETRAGTDVRQIQEMVERRDETGLRERLKGIYGGLAESGDIRGIKTVSRELFRMLKQYMDSMEGGRKPLDLTTETNYRQWLDCGHISAWFCACFLTLIEELRQMDAKNYSRPVVLAISYIQKHYQEHNLTIGDIAGQVHISTGHLCGLFKKETGETLNHYITEVRIEEAKRLLEAGELKIYEVSLAVGYQSSQYFSQIFFKMTGTYPTNWERERRRR